MGNILILYDGKSGNTKKMAEYVHRGASKNSNNEVILKNLEDTTADDIKWCDGIAVGAPTNMGILSWKMKKFWDEQQEELWGKIDGKIGCAFEVLLPCGLPMQFILPVFLRMSKRIIAVFL